jgi:hypothetical protein
MLRFLLSAILLGTTFDVIAGDVTGKINVVQPNTHPNWNGILIQMADGKIVDPNCGNNTWALIRVATELDKALVAVAITAQTTQRQVRVFTSECSIPPATLGTVPVVLAIDLGIRQ